MSKNVTMKQYNRSSYDEIYPKTIGSQVSGITVDQVSGAASTSYVDSVSKSKIFSYEKTFDTATAWKNIYSAEERIEIPTEKVNIMCHKSLLTFELIFKSGFAFTASYMSSISNCYVGIGDTFGGSSGLQPIYFCTGAVTLQSAVTLAEDIKIERTYINSFSNFSQSSSIMEKYFTAMTATTKDSNGVVSGFQLNSNSNMFLRRQENHSSGREPWATGTFQFNIYGL